MMMTHNLIQFPVQRWTGPKDLLQEAEDMEGEAPSAGDVLREVLGHEETIEDVVILLRDADSQLGFVTTLADADEVLAFIERVKFKVVQHLDATSHKPAPPKGTA